MQGGFPQSPCASSSPVTWGCCHFLQPITTDRRNSKASALRRSFLQSLTTVQSATSTTSRPGATQKLAVHNMSHAHAVTGHSGPSSHADRFRKAQGIVWRSKRHPVQGISDSNVRSRTDSACSCTPQSLLHSPASESPLDKMDEPDRREYTVEDAIAAVGFGSHQTYLLVYAGMAWAAEAMEMMLLSFAGPAVQEAWNLSIRQESLISSVVFAGMMIGAYSWGVLSDLKGRRFGFFATAVLTFVAGVLSALSPNYYSLLLFRALVGVGLGGGPVVSSWFMEFVPSPNRGLWMIIVSLFWTFGSVAEATLAWAVMPTLGWRWLLGLSALPLGALLVFYPIVPESPRYLATKGDTEEAQKILQSMAKVNGRQLPAGRLVQPTMSSVEMGSKAPEIESKVPHVSVKRDGERERLEEAEEVRLLRREDGINVEKSRGVILNLSGLLSPPLIRSTLILWSVFFSNAFVYYGLVLLTSQLSGGGRNCGTNFGEVPAASFGSTNLYRDVFITSLAELPGLGIAAAIVERIGRKRSMAALFGLSAVFLFPLIHPMPEAITTMSLFGARASIMGAFTVLYIYAPEVYPTSSRSTGLGIANSCARVGGLVCPPVAVDLVRSCQQPLAVGLFASMALLASIAVLLLPVETIGKPLSDDVALDA